MNKLIQILSLALLFPVSHMYCQAAEAKKVVLPIEAIADSAILSHQEFTQLYPGIDISEYGVTDQGWYVSYRHGSLLYLFGPSEDLEYIREQKQLLEQIRLNAILKQPGLSASVIDLVRFDYELTRIADLPEFQTAP